MTYQEILEKVSEELDIPIEVVKVAYNSYWSFIRDTIIRLPLKEELNEDDFNMLRTNFNIPSLGKLTCTYNRMLGVKKRFEYIKNIRRNGRLES